MPDPGAEPHAAHLQQALLAAQVELGAALGRIVEGGCALSGLLQWLAAEYALAGAAAAALESIRPRLATSTAPWTQAQMAALREAGLLGLTVPSALGGHGQGLLGLAAVTETTACGCASTA